MTKYLEEAAQLPTEIQVPEMPLMEPVLKCPSCGLDMVLRNKREGNGKYISCIAFPSCRNAVWLPGLVEEVELSGETCPEVCSQILTTQIKHLYSFFN